MVDPRVNGFDPQEILRDFDEGTVVGGVREWEIVAREKEIEVAPGVRYLAWTYNDRVPGLTLRAREGSGCASSSPVARPARAAHRHPPGVMDGVPGIGDGNINPGTRTVYEFGRDALRPPPLSLPLDAARRAHRQGALRGRRHRSQAGPSAGR